MHNMTLPPLICRTLVAVALCSLYTGTSRGQTTRNVPSSRYPTIQSAIDASATGSLTNPSGNDTVAVAPGHYLESIDFRGKIISVVATSADRTQTWIDGSLNLDLPAVRFISGESRTIDTNGQPVGTLLKGFLITNGGGEFDAGNGTIASGGIRIVNSAPIIVGNIIKQSACYGVHSVSSQPLIQGNDINTIVVQSNECHSPGAGILVEGTATNSTLRPVIRGNTIENNGFANPPGFPPSVGGSGIRVDGVDGVTIDGNTLSGNDNSGTGGGIFVSNTDSVFIVNNLIVNNIAEQGTAIWFSSPVRTTGPPDAVISNNTIVYNHRPLSSTNLLGDADAQVVLSGDLSRLVVANNIIYGSVATTADLSCLDPIVPGIPPAIEANDFYSSVSGNTLVGAALCSAQGTQFGNVSVDPRFNYIPADPRFNNLAGDYHLQAGSPLLDRGNSSVILDLALNGVESASDLDGNPRTVDATGKGYPQIDFGAYEHPGALDATLNALLLTAAGAPPYTGYEFPGSGTAQLTAAVSNSSTAPPVPSSGLVTLSRVNPDGTTAPPDTQTLTLSPASPTNPSGDAASFSSGPLTPGLYTFQASYPTPSAGSPATAIHTYVLVDPYLTALNLTCTPNPVTVGRPATFSLTLSPPLTGQVISGTVTFSIDGHVTDTVPLDANGNATYILPKPPNLNPLTIGTHTVQAVYSGTANYGIAPSNACVLVVNPADGSTTTTLTALPNPALALHTVTLTASTTGSSGGAAPTGTVTFFDGTSPLGAPVPLNPGGVATLIYSQFTAGPTGVPLAHIVHAVYSGDGTYGSSTSADVSELINANPTATSISVTPPGTAAFQQVVLSAHTASPFTQVPVNLTPSCNPACPAPIVTFFNGNTALGSAPLDTAGDASLTINPGAGSYNMTAAYSGSAIFLPSTSAPAPLAVTAVQATFSLTAAPSTIVVRQTTQLTATLVLPGAPASALAGTVLFADGASPIGNASIVNGTVTVPYAPNTSGTHLLTAHFNGNGSLLPADATFSLTVLPQDFTITPSDPSITIKAEHHTSTSVRINTTGGLTDTIDLACGNLPAYLTCQFRPVEIAVGAAASNTASGADSATNVALYLDTDFVQGYARLDRPNRPGISGHTSSPRAYGVAVLGLLCPIAVLFGLRRRVSLPRLLLAMIVSAGVLGASGCSGLYPPHVEPGTYTVILTGHAQNTAITRTAQLRVVITP